tara:strand:+ start:563 stop:820 length:258 start_codon:yes stop_codon:yes gene_type:complete
MSSRISAKKAPEIIRTIAIFWQGSYRLTQTTNQYACLAIAIAFSAKDIRKDENISVTIGHNLFGMEYMKDHDVYTFYENLHHSSI